jgi:hypothetical protein
VNLPGGRALTVRPVTADDVDGLAALYGRLSIDDLHSRFFSVFRPDRAFFERVASVASRGGHGLVALVRSPPGDSGAGTGDGTDTGDGDGDGELVAEAGYELLPNGDGELALAVDPTWRGWLGPYLLDALLADAHQLGVPNLEADILVVNGPMLSLVHGRGYATLANDDWATVRVVMATEGRQPSWPGPHDRPRVLVEVPGSRWHAGMDADASGVQVMACGGPARARGGCPVLRGERCPLVDGADVVVVSHGDDDPRWDALVRAHRQAAAGPPVCLDPPRGSHPPDLPAEAGVPRAPQGEGPGPVVAFVRHLAARRAADG